MKGIYNGPSKIVAPIALTTFVLVVFMNAMDFLPVDIMSSFYEHVFGDYRTLFHAVERYRRVTVEDCRRVARATFAPERRTIAELVPVPEPGSQP